ncbi:hypothetical protein [Sphaerimonospora mesophila]
MPRRVPSGTRLAGHALERLLGDDPALGSSAYRRELREVLQTRPLP